MIGRMPNDGTPARPPEIVLYERNGCHLCDEASVLLDEMIGPDSYRRVDVDTHDDLLFRYGHRVPVVAVNGTDRLELLISAPEVAELAAELKADD